MNPRIDPRPRRTRLVGFLLLVLLPVSASADADDDFKLARNLFRDAGDYATAAQLLAAFIRNHPSAPQQADARLLLARSYARSQRCREAVPAFEDFYLGYSDHLEAPAARRERSDCLVRMGKFGIAATGYEDVQRLYSEAQYAAGPLLSAASSYA
ncbi:MAG TPA: tetratricopeptide repeat protein, partial [Candidatus Handelsmanbacteria bacterium]|nr:tetratricopeptide repeat protein [Candidatus Handelsmanbacteria bacterium]